MRKVSKKLCYPIFPCRNRYLICNQKFILGILLSYQSCCNSFLSLKSPLWASHDIFIASSGEDFSDMKERFLRFRASFTHHNPSHCTEFKYFLGWPGRFHWLKCGTFDGMEGDPSRGAPRRCLHDERANRKSHSSALLFRMTYMFQTYLPIAAATSTI